MEYVPDGDRLIVLVARPALKQWWRNVLQNPAVRVLVDGDERAGLAQVEVGTAKAEADLARYLVARPRAARVVSRSRDDTVVVSHELAPATSQRGVG